jgi:hypothetical protein
MSVGRPLYNVHQRTCPKCGALQTSPGSTVCEQCGTDLRAASVGSTTPRRIQIRLPRINASRIGGIFRQPVQLLGRGITSLLSLLFFLMRIGLKVSVVLLVIGSFVVGLSFIPAVSARVPATQQVTRTAKNWLQGAGDWASGLLASAKGETKPTRPTTSRTPGAAARPPAASAQRPAATRPAATQSFSIRSRPTGATVRLNAQTMGKTPLTLKVRAGTYKVMISRPGYVTITRTVTVQRGKSAALSVTLAAAKRSPTPPRRRTTPPAQPKTPQPPPPSEQGAPER